MLARVLLFALLLPTDALKLTPLTTRRSAVIAGVGALVPTAAHADAIEEIARKNAEAAKVAKAEKEAAKEQKELLDAAGAGLNGILTVGVVGILGAAGYFFLGIKGDADKVTVNNLEKNRLMTPKERRDAGLQ